MVSVLLSSFPLTQCFLSKPHFKTQLVFSSSNSSLKSSNVTTTNIDRRVPYVSLKKAVVLVSANAAKMERPRKERYPGKSKGFVDEMRAVAMKLHTKEQSKEGEKDPEGIPEEKPMAKWELTFDGYIRFLVDSKLVCDALEASVEKASFPCYVELRNTGLERSKQVAQDLEWFKEQGHVIPKPSFVALTYVRYLDELSEKDFQAFFCHFYNVYFAHSAGGRLMGKKVAETLTNERLLEFYKWDSDVSQLLLNVKEKLNKLAESWSREEKDRCLKETETAFKHSNHIRRLMLSS